MPADTPACGVQDAKERDDNRASESFHLGEHGWPKLVNKVVNVRAGVP